MIRLSEQIWDTTPEFRTNIEWVLLLDVLRKSLEEFLSLPVFMVDHWTDNQAADSTWSICSRIRVPISTQLRSCFVGSLCMSVTRGQSVHISADLLLFAGGLRHAVHPLSHENGKDILVLEFVQHPCSVGRWTSPILVADAYAEWEAFQTLEDLNNRY